MPASALEILQNFREIQNDQQYLRLLDYFADDAVYFDPAFGVHRGIAEIEPLFARMEGTVATSKARFTDWKIEAEHSCGWAEWSFVAANPQGVAVTVPGQTLYRLRDGKIVYHAAYLDTAEFARLHRHSELADPSTSLGLSASPEHPRGAAHDLFQKVWSAQATGGYSAMGEFMRDDAVYISMLDGVQAGRTEIRAFLERLDASVQAAGGDGVLVDSAGDDRVGWAQWNARFDHGDVPCWTLFACLDDEITYVRSCFDAVRMRELMAAAAA